MPFILLELQPLPHNSGSAEQMFGEKQQILHEEQDD
jgi:hypothetical protein